MPIPFLDLSKQNQEVESEVADAFARVVSGGRFILGPEVEAFEEEWARYCQLPATAAVASGTDALTLALIASGAVRRGAGDEVIVPTMTSAYTGLAVLNAGGLPIFADVDPLTYTLDGDAIEKTITPRTRAVVPVHLYGQMAKMDDICATAEKHNLIVIEDAAQAHGATLDGLSAGAFGHAAAYSFYPTKNLGAAGDGGIVVSQDDRLIERVKVLRQGGHSLALEGSTEGRNSRLDEVQAAILRVKLRRLNDWNQQRRKLAALYDEMLAPALRLRRPVAQQPGSHVFHLYVVNHPQRDALRSFLTGRGIETLVHYPYLLHQQKLFRRTHQSPLPVAGHLAGRIMSLPLHAHLTEDEVRSVANAIVEFETSQPG